jgi:hypothetical protein
VLADSVALLPSQKAATLVGVIDAGGGGFSVTFAAIAEVELQAGVEQMLTVTVYTPPVVAV